MAGYSPTPLAKKLGIREHMHVCVLDAPTDYAMLVAPLPDGVVLATRLRPETRVVHVFVTKRAVLKDRLERFRASLASDASVWVSWPKKASKLETEVNEQTVRDLALPLGFVDIKVCAVDDIWSGLKLVVRKSLR